MRNYIFLSTFIAILSGFSGASCIAQQPISTETHYPTLIRAELPLYPSLTSTLRIGGTVRIEVTVEKGALVNAEVKSAEIEFNDPKRAALYDREARKKMADQFLSTPSLENIKTWRFRPEVRATFLVTFIYKIEGEETELPENPRLELDLPRLVKIIARPFKPTCDDCSSSLVAWDKTRRRVPRVPLFGTLVLQ